MNGPSGFFLTLALVFAMSMGIMYLHLHYDGHTYLDGDGSVLEQEAKR